MVKNPAQRIYPYLQYDDAPAAIEFLERAFGFEEKFRIPMSDGRLGHAEVELEGVVVMLASAYPEMSLVSPRSLDGVPSQVLIYVDDVDAHFERARAAGAPIDAEPEDQFYGDRVYRCRDPEGHRWTFSTHVRDISPEEWEIPSGP